MSYEKRVNYTIADVIEMQSQCHKLPNIKPLSTIEDVLQYEGFEVIEILERDGINTYKVKCTQDMIKRGKEIIEIHKKCEIEFEYGYDLEGQYELQIKEVGFNLAGGLYVKLVEAKYPEEVFAIIEA